MFCVFGALAEAQLAGKQAHLIPLSKAQADEAGESIVSGVSETQAIPDTGNAQGFVLRAAGAQDLTLVPGELSIDTPAKADTIQMQCGLFTLNPQGKSHYVPVIGPDYKPYSWCEQLDAMGLTADTGPRPRLILVFLLRTLSGNHDDTPFLLVWDPAASTYKVDYPASSWLADQRAGNTVAGARRLLQQHRR